MRRRQALLLLSLLPALRPLQAEGRTVKPQKAAPAGDFPCARYDALLRKHVDDQGRVDYGRLLAEDREGVEDLYAAIAAHPPPRAKSLVRRGPARSEALSFYLCAYNLLVWKALLDRLSQAGNAADASSVSVLQDRLVFFSFTRYLVAGEPLSLDELLRRQILPLFADARVHFALHFGARGCPRLLPEALSPERVEDQLDDRARRFLGDRHNVEQDEAAGKLRLSSILWWHREDFGKDEAALLGFINRYRPDGDKLLARPGMHIEYLDFDWRLNSR